MNILYEFFDMHGLDIEKRAQNSQFEVEIEIFGIKILK